MPEIVTRAPVTGSAPVAVDRPPVAGSTPTAPARVRPAASPEVAESFDAVLGTILYSPDRKLAIVDGRIVAVGDDVRGAKVVEITAAAVTLRDAQGRLRQLTLRNAAR
jgi:hypothetical protein